MSLTAGVIAVQGDVSEHADAIERTASLNGDDAEVIGIRRSGLVPECDLLSMPGGESTTISRLIHREGIAREIVEHVDSGKPLLATCAGLIVASRDARDDRVQTLGILDVTIDRNAFGRQRDSFETELDVRGLEEPVPAVFIRAPVVSEVGDALILAKHDRKVVAVRDGPVVGTAFHPELTNSTAIHRLTFFETQRS